MNLVGVFSPLLEWFVMLKKKILLVFFIQTFKHLYQCFIVCFKILIYFSEQWHLSLCHLASLCDFASLLGFLTHTRYASGT